MFDVIGPWGNAGVYRVTVYGCVFAVLGRGLGVLCRGLLGMQRVLVVVVYVGVSWAERPWDGMQYERVSGQGRRAWR